MAGVKIGLVGARDIQRHAVAEELVSIGATVSMMDVEVVLLVFYLLLALGVSFLCSLAESSLLSISRSSIAALDKAGHRSGRMLHAMKENIDRPLAGILTLNTIAHTVGAAGVGAQSLVVFGDRWVAVSSAILTFLILVFSEIIPKTIGVVYAARLAGFTAYSVQGMVVLTYPLVVAFQALSSAISRESEPRMTREEFALIAELGQTEGALQYQEYRVIHNLLRLRRIRVHEIMTPRTVVFMLPKDRRIDDVITEHGPLQFARIPVFESGKDDADQYVLRHGIYEAQRAGQGGEPLSQIARDLHTVPETASVSLVLHEFIARHDHMFMVVDEHGGTAGIVTLEDAIETLLGMEIVDETDTVPDMRKLAGALFRSKLRGRRF